MNVLEVIINFLRKIFGYKNDLYYLYCQESLPMPLTAQEEKAQVERLKTEDTEDAKRVLIERNLRLVVYIARKFENTGNDVEDLISIGTIGLIKAVNGFDPEKNIKLATFASRCIENEILMQLRRSVKRKCEVSLDEPLNVDYEGNELLMSDVLGTDADVVTKQLELDVEKELLYKAMEKLTVREKNIMALRYGLCGDDEKTQKEVADMMGISQSYISRLEKKIIIRLKKEMAKAL